MAGLGAASVVRPGLLSDEPDKPYVRANTDWLAKCRYGIGVHWTAQTVPRKGKPLPFQKAVDAFGVEKLVERLAYAGADYLLFTSTHALQMLAAPHPVIDKILPGRTCKRDLIAELADALAAKGISLLVYYNHSCNSKQDAAWEQAVGYHAWRAGPGCITGWIQRSPSRCTPTKKSFASSEPATPTKPR